jgi:hypothetical protein
VSRPAGQTGGPAARRQSLLRASAIALLAGACSASDPARTQPPATPASGGSAQGPGPAVGETLPAFEAPDQTGRVWTFESLRGPKGLVLNVNRSVVW